MEWKILMLSSTLPFTILLTTVQADACGNRCTSTQICGDSGECLERSDLITCYSLGSIYDGHYCLKTQECCDKGCMPEGSECCRFLSFYCKSGHSCCTIGCCPPGTFCSGFDCKDDRFSTQKPTTATPLSTSKPRTTQKVTPRTTAKPITRYPPKTTAKPITRYPPRTTAHPITRYPPRTTKWFENKTQRSSTNDSKSEMKPWVYAVIVIVVIVVISVAVVVALLIRRRQNTTSGSQHSRKGVVLNAPTQMYGQGIKSNGTSFGVPIQAKKPPQQLTNKPVTPALPTGSSKNNKKIEVFSM